MPKNYETPELRLIAAASEIVMGSGLGPSDNGLQSAPDFEFEHDWPQI